MGNIFAEFGLMLFMSIYFILPAYIANGSAVLAGGGMPIDHGKNFTDGKRVFGSGKTIKGFIGGVAIGFIAGMLLMLLSPVLNTAIQQFILDWGLNPQIGLNAEIIFRFDPLRAFLMALGALTGDLIGSFLKRRLNLDRGKPAPLLDQLDFVGFALLFTYLLAPLSWEYIVILLVFTPIIHLLANIIAYKMRWKKEPW
ncbi:MAG: CDP-2,3-bis-(O-geranylgeranyl)-sn-glycerol synthase [Candidatus Odinarchaeia archaeon]